MTIYQVVWPILRFLTGKRRLKLSQRLRSDEFGGGHFGAGRGNRPHYGLDIATIPGEPIYAPVDMYVERTAQPGGKGLEGIRFSAGSSSDGTYGNIFYIWPVIKGQEYNGSRVPIDKWVNEGELIGYAQNLHEAYPVGMEHHVHVEQRYLGVPVDITNEYAGIN